MWKGLPVSIWGITGPRILTTTKNIHKVSVRWGGDHNRLTEAQSAVTDSELIDMLNLSDDADLPDWVKEMVVNTSRRAMGHHK